MEKHLPLIQDNDQVSDEFNNFIQHDCQDAMLTFTSDEQLDQDQLERVIGECSFTDRKPLRDEIVGAMLVNLSFPNDHPK